MKVLMISTDRSAFQKGSPFQERLSLYGKRLGHITVIVVGGMGEVHLSEHVTVRGVRGFSKWGSLRKAYNIGKTLIEPGPPQWLVTTQDEITGLVGFWLRGLFDIPWRAEIHTDIMSPWYGKVFFTNKIRKLVFRLTIARASCIRVVSDRVKKSLIQKKFIHAQIVVLPVKPRAIIRPAAPAREKFFLVVSRLTREKNVALAIAAFKEVAGVAGDVVLKIVGEGPERRKLEQLASRLGIRSRVIFLGWQDNPGALFSTAQGLLSTSWYEGFGLSILEAMAVGCPIITTDVGIAGETIKDGVSGLVVPPGDRRGMTNGMLRLLQDPGLGVRLGEEAEKASHLYYDEHLYWMMFDQSFKQCKPSL